MASHDNFKQRVYSEVPQRKYEQWVKSRAAKHSIEWFQKGNLNGVGSWVHHRQAIGITQVEYAPANGHVRDAPDMGFIRRIRQR